jgi:hypothetical protein
MQVEEEEQPLQGVQVEQPPQGVQPGPEVEGEGQDVRQGVEELA